MNHRLKIVIDGAERSIPIGVSVAEVLGQLYIAEHGVLGAALNHHLVSLETELDADALLEPVLPESREGQTIVRRTAAHAFHSVVEQHFPNLQIKVGQSLLGGYYYEVLGETGSLEQLAAQIQQHLDALIEADVPIVREGASTEAAIHLIADPFGYKGRLLKAWSAPHVAIVRLGDYRDLMHGPCGPSTACIRGTRCLAYAPGLVLLFPEAAQTAPLPQPGLTHKKLFQAYREAVQWNELVGISAVGDLTDAALTDDFERVVLMAEALHEKKIVEIANQISERPEVRVICVAGPSSSGKTTFVQRLSVQLQVNGCRPLVLSLDDYYRNRIGDGSQQDFEALEALDLELLEKTLEGLLAGDEVDCIRYDFITGTQCVSGKVRLQPRQPILMEGIHGLNPAFLPKLPDRQKFRIFVSALTQLRIDEHNRIFTSDARLLRRIVRDRRTRGSSAASTIMRWPSVRRGEDRWIFPFQDHSDAMFNSTLVYETAVLRPFAWRYLLEVPRDHPARVRAYELLKFLELFVPVLPDAIPANSVLREFIGP